MNFSFQTSIEFNKNLPSLLGQLQNFKSEEEIRSEQKNYGLGFVSKEYLKKIKDKSSAQIIIEETGEKYDVRMQPYSEKIITVAKNEIETNPHICKLIKEISTPTLLPNHTLYLNPSKALSQFRNGCYNEKKMPSYSPVFKTLTHINFAERCFEYALSKSMGKFDLFEKVKPSYILSYYGHHVWQRIIQRFFIQTIEPQKGNLVVYYTKDPANDKSKSEDMTHFGIYHEENCIESKWGDNKVFLHPLFIAPLHYGNFVRYYRLREGLSPEKCLTEIVKTSFAPYYSLTESGKNKLEIKKILIDLFSSEEAQFYYGFYSSLSPSIFQDLSQEGCDSESYQLLQKFASYVIKCTKKSYDEGEYFLEYIDEMILAGFGAEEALHLLSDLINNPKYTIIQLLDFAHRIFSKPLNEERQCQLLQIMFDALTNENISIRKKALIILATCMSKKQIYSAGFKKLGNDLIKEMCKVYQEKAVYELNQVTESVEDGYLKDLLIMEVLLSLFENYKEQLDVSNLEEMILNIGAQYIEIFGNESDEVNLKDLVILLNNFMQEGVERNKIIVQALSKFVTLNSITGSPKFFYCLKEIYNKKLSLEHIEFIIKEFNLPLSFLTNK